MAELKRHLGMWGATGIAIGAIIGAGIFVLSGVASGMAGPAVILSFLIAGIVAFLTALSSAELSSFITEAGGSYIYTDKAFGKFLGFVVGWMQSFDYIVGASAISVGFAGYFVYFIGIPPTAQNVIILVAIAMPFSLMLINLKGIKEASVTNNLMVWFKGTALTIFVLLGLYYLISHGDYSNYHPFFPKGYPGMISGAALIFFAFVGFNTITVISEEIKEPEKNVPKSIIFAFLICTSLYIGVSVVEVGLVNWKIIGASSAPLELALTVATGNIFILKFVAISALFATLSATMASILGGSRALFAMARQRVLPGFLSNISKNGIPTSSVLACGVAITLIIIGTKGNLELIASIFNFGTLLTFFFINLSMIQLRKKMPDANRTFKVPLYPIPPLLGIISCFALILFLKSNAIIAAGIWIVIGVVAYLINQQRQSKTG
ncbi:MAG: APC family permease [ANME-2 cluster archaeon]|nr:APC family permease [ANME-2 cluster archaeon]